MGFGFAQFLVYCLETYAVPDAKNILLAGQLIVKLVETMKAAPARLTLPLHLELMDTWRQHMAVIRYLDIYLPKHHLMYHLILRSDLHGNPWKDATFIDESLKKELKLCCRLSHQRTFECIVIVKVGEILVRLLKKRRVQ